MSRPLQKHQGGDAVETGGRVQPGRPRGRNLGSVVRSQHFLSTRVRVCVQVFNGELPVGALGHVHGP